MSGAPAIQASAAATSAEIDRLFGVMPGRDASLVLAFADALLVFERASDKASAARAIAERFAPMGLRGLTLPSLYRKLADYRAGGVWSLVPAKWRREARGGMAANAEFVGHWQGLCLGNRRKVRPAWRRLVEGFCGGAEVPGVGTWRDLYLKEFGLLPAEGEPCPWDVRNPPPGWSLRSMMRLAPDPFAMEAARRGMADAKAAFGLMVRRTRAGVPCCAVVEIDDFVYELKVVYSGNLSPQRVVGLHALDRRTAHEICHFMKVVREREDGTRETLVSAWAKYIYHYVLCLSGIPDGGCVLRGERGTARTDAEFDAALALVNAWRASQGLGKVSFDGGALQNAPLAKGLHDGAAKGNPRHKGSVEQWHATLKNEMGRLLGEIGGGRGVKPDEEGAMVREAKRLSMMAFARGLPSEAMASPFMSWRDFQAEAEEIHRRIDERTLHDLEGWEECGYVAGEFRLKAEASWRSVKALREMSPEEAGAVSAMVQAGYAEYRERRLSPREAWEREKASLRTVPEYLAPQLLGKSLRVVAKVGERMQFSYTDQNLGSKIVVAAVAGGKLLDRGREYQLWVNPLDSGKAYVCDMEGTYLGTAKVMQAVRADATPEDLAAQLGLRQHVLAEEARRLGPIARKRLKEANERALRNLDALGLSDPVREKAAADAAAREVSGAKAADFVPPPDAGEWRPEVDIDEACAGAAGGGERADILDFTV